MSQQTPPPPKRQKVEIGETNDVELASSPPIAPLISKTGASKRVIPDTPGSPSVQVLASSPVSAANGASTVNGSATRSSTNGPAVPNGTNNSNHAATAVAEAMKLAN